MLNVTSALLDKIPLTLTYSILFERKAWLQTWVVSWIPWSITSSAYCRFEEGVCILSNTFEKSSRIRSTLFSLSIALAQSCIVLVSFISTKMPKWNQSWNFNIMLCRWRWVYRLLNTTFGWSTLVCIADTSAFDDFKPLTSS